MTADWGNCERPVYFYVPLPRKFNKLAESNKLNCELPVTCKYRNKTMFSVPLRLIQTDGHFKGDAHKYTLAKSFWSVDNFKQIFGEMMALGNKTYTYEVEFYD